MNDIQITDEMVARGAAELEGLGERFSDVALGVADRQDYARDVLRAGLVTKSHLDDPIAVAAGIATDPLEPIREAIEMGRHRGMLAMWSVTAVTPMVTEDPQLARHLADRAGAEVARKTLEQIEIVAIEGVTSVGCPACNGQGFTVQKVGVAPPRDVQCGACDGSGRVTG